MLKFKKILKEENSWDEKYIDPENPVYYAQIIVNQKVEEDIEFVDLEELQMADSMVLSRIDELTMGLMNVDPNHQKQGHEYTISGTFDYEDTRTQQEEGGYFEVVFGRLDKKALSPEEIDQIDQNLNL